MTLEHGSWQLPFRDKWDTFCAPRCKSLCSSGHNLYNLRCATQQWSLLGLVQPSEKANASDGWADTNQQFWELASIRAATCCIHYTLCIFHSTVLIFPEPKSSLPPCSWAAGASQHCSLGDCLGTEWSCSYIEKTSLSRQVLVTGIKPFCKHFWKYKQE